MSIICGAIDYSPSRGEPGRVRRSPKPPRPRPSEEDAGFFRFRAPRGFRRGGRGGLQTGADHEGVHHCAETSEVKARAPTRERRASARPTPIWRRRAPASPPPSRRRPSWRPSRDAWLKLENLQITGSFKVRGALNAIARGVESGDRRADRRRLRGESRQGVAWAARRFGLSACVVVPRDAPRAKVEGCRALGAEIVVGGDGYESCWPWPTNWPAGAAAGSCTRSTIRT